MRPVLVHSGHPVAGPHVLTDWYNRILKAWPNADQWIVAMLATQLANPSIRCTALLAMADALEEARRQASLESRLALSTGLSAMADIARQEARLRPDQETIR